MDEKFNVTISESDLSDEVQIRAALQEVVAKGGAAKTPDIYEAVERLMNGAKLSSGAKTHLRVLMSRDAVQAGYIHPYDEENGGWRITPEGKEFLSSEFVPTEEVLNVETELTEKVLSVSARGAAFENYVLQLLKKIYPHYAWYHQGMHKGNERVLDFIGSWIGEVADDARSIGVQVKFHAPNAAPSQLE